jgi:hypothetical protein
LIFISKYNLLKSTICSKVQFAQKYNLFKSTIYSKVQIQFAQGKDNYGRSVSVPSLRDRSGEAGIEAGIEDGGEEGALELWFEEEEEELVIFVDQRLVSGLEVGLTSESG